ncbi:hypothetical protein B6S44_19515 [Bosea sp. Tri-44]|uniref:hypothetical protein n=1 Tax=Bosea sp. Tri-44 TaxID=1972137 RepID=UPI00100EB257|nr:hypothetical protein [Bosea sp. Tri-44]RXT52930.1 hypothetical protein B6S44_19515 [Bosea sp. Tri-44]
MRTTAIILAHLLISGASPALAQERHPLVTKFIELRVAARVVSDKCEGWSLNPAVGALMSTVIGFAGLAHQVERIDEAEIAGIADRSIAEHWQSDRVAEQCEAARTLTMPNPVKPEETLPLFVQAR